jgi:hypothetical protein
VTAARRNTLLWGAAFVLLGLLLVARNITALSSVPPGLYVDESSIGYNAWTIAHYGVDEHGVRLPLFFECFEDYKNPVYIYALAPLTLVFPLTSTLERFPAAIFGLVAILFVTLTAWRLSRSRPITLFAMVLAGLTPWLILESRVGFELVAMVALLAGAFWCLAAEDRLSPRRFVLAGVFFALALYGYSTGRLEILLFAVAFVLAYGARKPRRGWWLTLVPIVAAYGVLAVWNLLNPGALTKRFALLSVGADGAPLTTVIGRFFANYVTFFEPDFLFINGDVNVRHSTGYAGLLLAVCAPLLLFGLWACWRRRRQSFPRLIVACLIVSPVAAALTNEGIPHALRGATMLPVLLVLCVYGLIGVRDFLDSTLTRLRPLAAALVVGGTLLQAGFYAVDLYTAYPVRAAPSFDTGVEPAVAVAASNAHGHALYLTNHVSEPYIQAFFALLPPPPSIPVKNSRTLGLLRLGVTVIDPALAEQESGSGDVLVLTRGDPLPDVPFDVLGHWDIPQDPLASAQPPTVLITVVRLR